MSRPNGINYPLGLFTDVQGSGRTGTAGAIDQNQGGFLALSTIPTFGGTDFNSPAGESINVAAGKLYYYIVHGNSRNISYDKSDLIRCLMGFDSLQCVIADAIRAYKFIKAVDPQNRWYKLIVKGLGWDYDDLSRNIVQFRTAINFAIQRFNQISIPNVFDIFSAHKHLYDYVYTDRPGVKCQFMAPTLDGFWFFNDEKATVDWTTEITWQGTTYYFGRKQGHLKTVNDFIGVSNFLLHTLYDSTDMGVMQGDIKKAFQSSEMLTMYMLDEENDVPLMYDNKEFNLKVHNMELSYPLIQAGTYTLTTDALSYKPKMTYRDTDLVDGNLVLLAHLDVNAVGSEYADDVHMMDLPDDLSSDVDSVVQMQLFKCSKPKIVNPGTKFYISDASTTSNLYSLSVGPYMITHMHWFVYTGDDFFGTSQYNLYEKFKAIDLTTTTGCYELMNYLTMSQLAVTIPIPVWFHTSAYGTDAYRQLPINWEVENVTVYSDDVLKNIQRTIIESLFYAPELYNGNSR